MSHRARIAQRRGVAHTAIHQSRCPGDRADDIRLAIRGSSQRDPGYCSRQTTTCRNSRGSEAPNPSIFGLSSDCDKAIVVKLQRKIPQGSTRWWPSKLLNLRMHLGDPLCPRQFLALYQNCMFSSLPFQSVVANLLKLMEPCGTWRLWTTTNSSAAPFRPQFVCPWSATSAVEINRATRQTKSGPDKRLGFQSVRILGHYEVKSLGRVASWKRFSFFSGTSQFKRPSDTSAASSAFDPP